ncbi:hypothetical protein N0V90_005280 [Kalmusia sp. IMI 367209]|nr:hypothetical protein N0V90_005280 [Kalmusia sp. IMI 367209]
MASDEFYLQSELYWRNALADSNTTTFPLPRLPSQLPNQLSAASTTANYELSTHFDECTKITMPVVIRGAWALVIGCMTNSTDVVFGVTVSEDSRSIVYETKGDDQESLLAPVRVKWSRDSTIADYLGAIRQQEDDMAFYERIGLDQIAAMSPECRQASEFQCVLAIRARDNSISQPALASFNRRALMLCILYDANYISVKAEFDSIAIDSWEVDAVLGQFTSLVQQLGQYHATERLADLKLLPHGNLQTIWDWNATTLPAANYCVHHIIEQHAHSQPNAIAVHAWDGQLTYSELNKLASLLACHLVDLGIGPDRLVPLCFEKSMWTMIALLGVLKAGGGFVLLDPSLPEERLRAMIRQTQAEFIISSTFTKDVSMRLLDKVIVISSSFFNELGSGRSLFSKPTLESVMYVVFTSGSTGTPKGAIISHKNFASAMKYQLDCYKVSTQMRMFDFSSYSFVASIANIFIAFTAGGCVCVPSEHDKRNNLAESIAFLRANVIHLTPSVARLITPNLVPAVELVIFSGEGLHIEDIKPWWGKVRVLNVLGLSECAPRSVLNVTSKALEEASRIGKGIGQVTWVVDPEDHNRLMPIGCVGELLLEGPLVGLGYLNDAKKTADSFIQDPLWLLEGCAPINSGRHGRLYKTGDLVRYNEDGSLSYIARKDAQAKIRGQRVELGEVEYWMKEALNGAQQVVVDVLKPRGDGTSPMLAAFIQQTRALDANNSSKTRIFPLAESTKELLTKHLPGYMIPTVLFSMSQLPTTATGKMDRRKLRSIGGSFTLQELADMRTAHTGPKRNPQSKQEEYIQSLWSQVLQIEPSDIGLDDTFVELGGDSVGAMKLVREGRNIGIDYLSVAYILSGATLENMAGKVHERLYDGPVHIPAFDLLPERPDLSSLLNEVSRSYGIEKEAIADIYPCTPLQEGLFSLSLKQGDYITQRVLRLVPGIDIDLFCKAWETVSLQMEILRTRLIPHAHGGLLQLVVNESISFVTTTSLEQYLRTDKQRPMEMGQPLIRYALVKNGIGGYGHFVLTIHHALYDGWSMRLILSAVEKVYRGHHLGTQPRFNKFIHYINQQDVESIKSYWKTYLDNYDGALYPTVAPAIHQSSIDTRFKYDISTIRISSPKVTVSSLVRAAWALVVGFEVDAADVVFGVPVSGRSVPLPDVDIMPAPSFATIPVRVQWGKKWRVVDYLDAVQKQSIETIPFEQAGLSLIAKAGEGCRRACDFQTLLLVQPNVSPIEETLGHWELEEYQELNTYALTLEIKLAAEKITVYAGFDSRTIENRVVQKMVRRLESVMQQLSRAGPRDLLSEVDVMMAEELEEIWTWNSNVPEAVECCVHTLIENQAMRVPNSPAIHAWDAEISYESLDRLSTMLAWRLQDLGLSSGDMVPLCFEKSAWIIVSLLAVVKAGGTFVLLDHTLPEQRLQVIVRQINARMIISSLSCQSLSSRLVEKVIPISANIASELKNQQGKILNGPSPNSILYVAFTSGSTGAPKGARVSHKNLASSIHHQMEHYAYYKGSRVFDFSSYSFDMSIFAILHTLAVGACLCIPHHERRKNDLAQSINTLRADTLIMTPSVMRTLQPAQIPHVTSILWIGEALSAKDVAPWAHRTIQLINAYGPAECTPVSTMNLNANAEEGAPHIGRGVGHITWVVDPSNHNRLAPIGTIGELLLEGPLVGQGYLGNLEKTQAAFIEDPPWLLQGSKDCLGRRGRLYKTGDLVKYNPDGTLNFIGRKDDQVKIRGQRVELGEIEYHLKRSLTDVTQAAAVVVSPSDGSLNPSLVAFIIRSSTNFGSELSTTGPGLEVDIRMSLAEHLPSYMIPAAIIDLEELPMTATGKTDRKTLRNIGSELLAKRQLEVRSKPPESKRKPSTPTEIQLQQIWSQVLKIPESDIGLDDSIFDLGGDSITAMKVCSIARAAFIDINSADVFQGQTLSQLADGSIVEDPLATLAALPP